MRDEARACGVDPYNADCRAAVEAHGALDIMRAAATGSIVYRLSGALLIHEAFEHSECTVCSRAIGTAAPVASASSQASQELHLGSGRSGRRSSRACVKVGGPV